MTLIPHIRTENGVRITAYPSDLAERCEDAGLSYIRDRVARGIWHNIFGEPQRTEVVDFTQLSEEDNEAAWMRLTGCPKRWQPEREVYQE